MIVEKRKDIIQGLKDKEITILAHGCNCRNKFASGLAYQILKKIPKAKYEYHKMFERRTVSLGMIQYVETKHGIVANCLSQKNYGNGLKNNRVYVSYEALEVIFQKLYQKTKEGHKVGIPKIGCGLAGGDWKKVKKIINKIFVDETITVYIWG